MAGPETYDVTGGQLQAATDSSFQLSEYLHLLRRRWRIILGLCLACAALGAIHYLITPRLYRAATMLHLEQRTIIPLGGERASWLDPWSSMKYYPTQYELLRSRGMAERVVRDLGLGGEAPSTADAGNAVDATADQRHLADVAAALLAGLDVDPVGNTELLEISYVATDPERAARVANGFADAYIEWGIETHAETVGRASSFLSNQIESLKQDILDKQAQLQGFGGEEDLAGLEPGSTAMNRLDDLNDEYGSALASLREKQAQYEQLLRSSNDAVLQGIPIATVDNLRGEQQRLEREYETKLKTYKPDWPEMIALRAQIDEGQDYLAKLIATEAGTIRRKAQAEYQGQLRQVRSIEAEMRTAKGSALNLNSAAAEYDNLLMEVENRRELLADLLRRLAEAGVSAQQQGTRDTNVRVVDRALVPAAPFRPSLRNNLSLGVALGLVVGIGLVLLIHFLDRTVKTSEELERLLELPVLAVIPEVGPGSQFLGRYSYTQLRRGKKPQRREHLDIELLPISHPNIVVSEAYRSLRTAVLLSSAEELKTLAITSAESGEGKTATAANLATVMAQLGHRVLLIDGDLRKPRLHTVFKISNRDGLVTSLTTGAELDSVCKATQVPNLTLCPSGPMPPNPSELLASARMAEVLTSVRGRYDMIVIDTPPVLAVTDPILVATYCDGTIVCFRTNGAPREDIRNCVDRLRQAEVRILGSVLNRYDTARGGRYQRRYRYYESYSSGAGESAA